MCPYREGHLSVAKPEAPPCNPPLWADAFYLACKTNIVYIKFCKNYVYNCINDYIVHEGNGGVARKGWGAGEGTTGFATLSGPFPASAKKSDLQANKMNKHAAGCAKAYTEMPLPVGAINWN